MTDVPKEPTSEPESHHAISRARMDQTLAKIDSSRLSAVRLRLQQIPARYRRPYVDSLLPDHKAAAIRAMCLECVGWKPVEVHACTAVACPLYAQRPYQKSAHEDDPQSTNDGLPDT